MNNQNWFISRLESGIEPKPSGVINKKEKLLVSPWTPSLTTLIAIYIIYMLISKEKKELILCLI
jgi:hypothetical protein